MIDMPKLVGDFKKKEKEKAMAETFVYCQQMMHKNKHCLPIFAMPACLDAFYVFLIKMARLLALQLLRRLK